MPPTSAGIALTGLAALICIERHSAVESTLTRPPFGVFVQVGSVNCVKVIGARVAPEHAGPPGPGRAGLIHKRGSAPGIARGRSGSPGIGLDRPGFDWSAGV